MDIRIRDRFTGPEITIEASAVKTSCAVVGNQGESFKTVRNIEVEAPMDFAIVRLVLICLSLCIRSHSQFTGYYEICRPRICPPQRRPLKLVHISNGLHMVEGVGPLQVGDVFRSEAFVTSTDATLLGSRITYIMTSPSSKSFRLHLLQRLREHIRDHRGA